MKIIKRNGKEVEFDKNKIVAAIRKANRDVDESKTIDDEKIIRIADKIESDCKNMLHAPTVEEVQDMVEESLYYVADFELTKAYITYRYNRSLVRKANTTDDSILSLINRCNTNILEENSNKNPIINSTQRDYMAGEVSKDLSRRVLLPKDVVEAHDAGIIHFHDTDYFAQLMSNCCLVNLDDMLTNGCCISNKRIDPPKSFAVACTVTTQIIAQVASAQYGGQSITLSHLAKFVDISRQKIKRNTIERFNKLGISYTEEQLNAYVEEKVDEEIRGGVQTIQYQIITLLTTNGQAPFITIFMYINEVPDGQIKKDLLKIINEMLRQRIKGVKNRKGVYVTPAFPKLIYVLDEDNVYPGTKYYETTILAAKCTAKRMVPDYISAKKIKEYKEGNCYPAMGCRSFLTPWKDENGNYKFYGRFNQGVVTLNLVDIACSSKGDMDKFWEIFDERLELCYKALMCRHDRLMGTPSDVAPILWQDGALARLEPGEKIDDLLLNNYSTLSLGYGGLCECVKYMTGKSHTDPEGKPFAIKVMQHLNDACAKWRKETSIGFSLYGTPMESTTYKFAKKLQERFGIIEGVTDKNYITNSYHVHVQEEIDAISKLKFESEFQALSPGGAISYVEVPDLTNNIDAVLSVMRCIYENIMYAEENCKSDYCQECGYDGEIKIVTNENGKKIWKCPNCGNTDQSKMNVARRTCGYIGENFWNVGRTDEIYDRVLHL